MQSFAQKTSPGLLGPHILMWKLGLSQSLTKHPPTWGSAPALHRVWQTHPSQSPCLIPEQGLKEPDYPPGRFLQVQQRGAGGADGGQDCRAGGPSGERGEVSPAQPWCRGPGGQRALHYRVFCSCASSCPPKPVEEGRASIALLKNCSHFRGRGTETHQSK